MAEKKTKKTVRKNKSQTKGKTATKKTTTKKKASKKKATNSMNPFRAGSKKQFLFDLLAETSTPLTVAQIEEAMDGAGRQTSPAVIRSWIGAMKKVPKVKVTAKRGEAGVSYKVKRG